MLFNVLTCILVLIFAVVFWNLIYSLFFKNKLNYDTFILFTSGTTLIIFMWIMSWQYCWREMF